MTDRTPERVVEDAFMEGAPESYRDAWLRNAAIVIDALRAEGMLCDKSLPQFRTFNPDALDRLADEWVVSPLIRRVAHQLHQVYGNVSEGAALNLAHDALYPIRDEVVQEGEVKVRLDGLEEQFNLAMKEAVHGSAPWVGHPLERATCHHCRPFAAIAARVVRAIATQPHASRWTEAVQPHEGAS